jgi:hypothetical protein
MKKRILDIELMNRPVPRMSKCEDCTDSCRLDNGTECFIIVNAWALSEASKDPASLVSVQRAISMKFMFENPLASDHVGLVGARNKIPGVVLHEGCIFIFHGATPVRICKGIATGPGNWRKSLGVEDARLNVSRLPTSHHAMIVVDRRNRYSTGRGGIFDKSWW